MVQLHWLFAFVLAALGVIADFNDDSAHCFPPGAPCSFNSDLYDICMDSHSNINATCRCVSGYIPVEQGCLWCKEKWADHDSILKLMIDNLAKDKAECSSKNIKISPIPSNILKSMSAYNATNTVDHPQTTSKKITNFSDIPTPTTWFGGSAHTRVISGGGDHTPTQWLTDTRNPNDVPLQTAQADDAKRVGVPLGLAAAAVLGLL